MKRAESKYIGNCECCGKRTAELAWNRVVGNWDFLCLGCQADDMAYSVDYEDRLEFEEELEF
jgi:hypothetical protein